MRTNTQLPDRIKKIRFVSVAYESDSEDDLEPVEGDTPRTWGDILFHLQDGMTITHEFYSSGDRQTLYHEKIYDVEAVENVGGIIGIASIDMIYYAASPYMFNTVCYSFIELSYALDFQLGD